MVSSQLLTLDEIAQLDINEHSRLEAALIGDMMKEQRVREKLGADVKKVLPRLMRTTE